MGDPTSIKALLLELARRVRFPIALRDPAVWQIWDEVVGETIALKARPHSFEAGTLWVACSGPHWMQQLQLMKETLRRKLNDRLGGERIKDIRFLIGDIPPSMMEEEPPMDISPEEAERILSPLKDEDLRQRALRILRAVKTIKHRFNK